MPLDAEERIRVPYLKVTNIPLHRDAAGQWWGDPLWVKDLLLHLECIEDLRLLCPSVAAPGAGWQRFDASSMIISTLAPQGRGWLMKLPSLYRQIDSAAAEAHIVHTGVTGWPFPLGWLATLAAVRRRKFLIILIESAPWRPTPGSRTSLKQRVKSAVFELFARACAKRADLLIVTQPAYLQMGGPAPRNSMLNPATWIDDEVVLSESAALASWQAKEDRFVVVGRLTADKGVLVLLEALRQLGDRAPQVDIVGEGELHDECARLAEEMPERVRMVPPVPYGPRFFELLDRYRGVLVPLKSDEQPRIVFDAYARAIPVLGSTAPGVASCVTDGQTGWLFEPGNADALARILRQAVAQPTSLRTMGFRARDAAERNTHREMHRTRVSRIIKAMATDPSLKARPVP